MPGTASVTAGAADMTVNSQFGVLFAAFIDHCLLLIAICMLLVVCHILYYTPS
jgi:hypothetical protein